MQNLSLFLLLVHNQSCRFLPRRSFVCETAQRLALAAVSLVASDGDGGLGGRGGRGLEEDAAVVLLGGVIRRGLLLLLLLLLRLLLLLLVLLLLNVSLDHGSDSALRRLGRKARNLT